MTNELAAMILETQAETAERNRQALLGTYSAEDRDQAEQTLEAYIEALRMGAAALRAQQCNWVKVDDRLPADDKISGAPAGGGPQG